MKENDGPIAQEAWGCPFATNAPPDRASLDDEHEKSLVAVEKLTGVRCSTCPNWYARKPWVHEVIAVRRWREKGAIRERCGWPSTLMVRAIDLVDVADAKRVADDLETAKRKAEADAEEAKREREHGR